jgi:plastocyanin
MHKPLATGALALGLSALAAVPAAADTTVRVGDNWFSPKELTVDQHSVVTWRFVGDNVHRIKVKSGPDSFKSPARSSGRYKRHMMYRGTYRIVCTIHAGQRMKLKVE